MDRERMYSLVPLASRLDRLDHIMKRLEGKHDGRRSSDITPLDLAVRDEYFKGSLLDRVSTLEYRLFQLSLEVESNSVARPPAVPYSRTAESSSTQGSKKPNLGTTFDIVNKNQTVQESQTKEPQTTRSTQKMSSYKAETKKKKSTKGQGGKDKGTREDSKNKIQQKPRSLPYLKLLGC